MSHFTLLVLSESPAHVDNQMAPFSEAPSEEYIRFVPATETREELEKVYQEMKERFHYKSFDEYMREYYGYTLCDASKTYGHYTNPDGKWDWYVQGGRWAGLLTLRPEAAKEYPPLVIEGKAYPGRANQARLRDIDFSPDAGAYARTLRFWDVNVEGMPLREDEREDSFLCLYKPEYYLEQYGSKEEFAQSESAFTTWALLTPEGEWHEKETWESSFTCWAMVEPLNSREFWEAAAVNREDELRITIRFRRDVDAAMRLSFRGEAYAITSVINPNAMNIKLELLVKSAMPEGK